jgi:hypothetical protein
MRWAGFPTQIERGGIAWPHRWQEGTWVAEPRLADNPAGYPSGFLLASLEDLTNLAVSLLNGTLIGADGLDLMISNPVPRWMDHAPTALGRIASGYGLGCFTGLWNGQRVIRHGGSQLTSNCSIDLLPESGAGIVLLTNGADDATFTKLLALCYEAVGGHPRPIEKPAAAPVTADEVLRCVGYYIDVETGRIIEIADESSRLVYRNGVTVAPMSPVGGGRWIASNATTSVPIGVPQGNDPVPHITAWGSLYLRTVIEPWNPGPRGSDLAGIYRDSFWPDPSTDLEVGHEGGQWCVTGDGHAASGRWIGPRRLATDHGLLAFVADGSSLVLGNATTFVR